MDCFERLEKAERSFDEGMQFGQAVIGLRDEIKANHSRNFKARLQELGITYAKARYWMAIAEGKEINRAMRRRRSPRRPRPIGTPLRIGTPPRTDSKSYPAS